MNWVNNVARSVGVVIIKKRSKTSKTKEVRKVWLQCERGGVYNDTSSSRESLTKKIGCPFELVACRNANKSWNLTVLCGTHTHANASNFEGHAFAMRLNDDEKKLVAELTKANVAPRNILSIIKDRNENNFSAITNVYNERHKIKTAVYRGSTRMEALMIALEANGFIYEVNANQETYQLEDLFFCHPTSLGICRSFPQVLLIDATYKTNVYLFFLILFDNNYIFFYLNDEIR